MSESTDIIAPMVKLKRSNDRKVANLVTKNGKQAAIANTFGLPAGKDFSCPGATSRLSVKLFATLGNLKDYSRQ